jgi:hypothetical protein
MSDLKFFQWIAGDRKGEVMVFDKIESEAPDIFIVFKDGSRINENFVAPINQRDLTGKYMVEIDSPTNVWTFKEEWVGREEERWEWRDETNPTEKVCVQPLVEGRKVIKLIPPKPTPKTSSKFGQIDNISPALIVTPESLQGKVGSNIIPTRENTDPVYILMSKSKKIDSEISMDITISLPSKNLYDIAKESFDEGHKKFIEYIIQEIADDEIKEALKIAITKWYEDQ